MKTYHKFPDYYDEIIRGNGYDLDSEVFFLNEVMENHGKGKEILEFACGTGVIAKELEKKGYSVIGVDLSEQMIQKAKSLSPIWGKYPKNEGDRGMEFIIGDMTSINVQKEFDVVLCNYNSVCHLISWEDWQKFFKNAYKHLKKDGILVFDILTVFEFENITRDFRGFFNIGKDVICLEMFKESSRDVLPKHLYKWLIKMFVHQEKNKYDLIEEEIKEISFPIENIQHELEKVGFIIEHMEDFHFGEVNDESERVYFVAKK